MTPLQILLALAPSAQALVEKLQEVIQVTAKTEEPDSAAPQAWRFDEYEIDKVAFLQEELVREQMTSESLRTELEAAHQNARDVTRVLQRVYTAYQTLTEALYGVSGA